MIRVNPVRVQQKVEFKKQVKKQPLVKEKVVTQEGVISQDMKGILNPVLPDNTPFGTYRFEIFKAK